MMKKELIGYALVVVVLILAFSMLYYLLIVKETPYYTKVDNTKVEEKEDGKYEYTLISYRENGEEKEIKFQTTRKLKDDAYLQLDVMFFRGVVRWKKVSINEIPIIVREKYKQGFAGGRFSSFFVARKNTYLLSKRYQK